jgi:cell division protein FtsW
MARKLQADRWLFVATAGLALFGVVMVYSASAVMSVQEGHNQFYYVIKQSVWTMIGFVVMMVTMQFDYQRLRRWWIVYPLLLLTILLLLSVFGFAPVNGARRWIRFNGFSAQPSEVAKLSLVIFLAYFLERRAGEERLFWKTFIPCIFVLGLLAGLVLREPDLGTALMLAIVCFVVCYAAGVRPRHLAIAALPAVVGAGLMMTLTPFRWARMAAFVDPWAAQQGAGYQAVQSLIAVGSGGSNGLGFAQGKQKLLFLPFAHSDFIFAIVGEELGLVGTLIVVFVFGFFLWRGLRAALRAPDRFGMLLGLGIVVGIVAQALLNISVVVALVPTKGIPLPFISYGGSSMVPGLAAVGILLNISQYTSFSTNVANYNDGDEEELAWARGARRRSAPYRGAAVARARYG